MKSVVDPTTPHRPLRVLVVEDEPDALKAILASHEALGHWAAGLSSAELALHSYLDGAFDVVMTDVGLPGLSGHDLAEILATKGPVPMVFATGRPAPEKLPALSVWLQKPFTLDQLSDALTQAAKLGDAQAASPEEGSVSR